MTQARGRLYAGTSGFAYPGWSPLFYPAGTRQSALLGAYAGRLDAVELHNTFYRRPSPAAVAAWVAATPEHFRFCPKAQRGASWGAFRGDDPVPSVSWLTGAVEAFGERLGLVLLSIPATVKRDDAPSLGSWTPGLDRSVSRSSSPTRAGLTTRSSAAWPRTGSRSSPPTSMAPTSPTCAGSAMPSTCACVGSPTTTLTSLAGRLASQPFLDDGLDVYAFFRHDEDGTSALRAEALGRLLGR